MEKTKIKDLNGEELNHYEWQFTEEEKKEIRRILKNKAPEKNIKSFIHYLQGLCMLKKMLLEQSKRKEIRSTREDILKDCRLALRRLRAVHRGVTVTWYDETLDPFWNYQPDQQKICPECGHPFTTAGGRREKCVQCEPSPPEPEKREESFLVQQIEAAGEVIQPLVKFIKVMEKYHKAENKGPGRKNADSDHFIEKIKNIYAEYIGKPSSYTKSNAGKGGQFFQVIAYVYSILGIKDDLTDTRALRRVVKK